MRDFTTLSLAQAREMLVEQFSAFLGPFLQQMETRLEHRLVRSLGQALRAILAHPRPEQALMLTTFAEQTAPGTKLIHTVKRFFRLLHHPSLKAEAIAEWSLERATQLWGDPANELVIVDGSVLTKPYAKEMEYLARVKNPLEKLGGPKTVPGYWVLLGVRTSLAKGMAQMLSWRVWSSKEVGFLSQNQVEEEFFQGLLERVRRRAVFVLDRGLGRFALLGQLAEQSARFVARVSINRDFAVDEESMIHLRVLAYRLPLTYERQVYDPFDKKEKLCRFAYRRVKRPGIPGELTLVVQWLEGLAEPWLLLTNEAVRNEAEAWRIVAIYWRRMAVEESLRFLKSEVGLESFRVREFAAIQRVVALGMLVYSFLIELLEVGGVLVRRLCRAARWLGLKRERETVYKLRWAISLLLNWLPAGYG